MSVPTRALVSEAFVNQMETIEKTLIEVQNQPASFYGRRTTQRTAPQNAYYPAKYGYYSGRQGQTPSQGVGQGQMNQYPNVQQQSIQQSLNIQQNMQQQQQEYYRPSTTPAVHVPKVFEEDQYSTGSSSYSSGKLATFDPFSENKERLFQPMFNSSNSILGSNFSANSNIWGDTKTMSDAAVWG